MRVLFLTLAMMMIPFMGNAHQDEDGHIACHMDAEGVVHCHVSKELQIEPITPFKGLWKAKLLQANTFRPE